MNHNKHESEKSTSFGADNKEMNIYRYKAALKYLYGSIIKECTDETKARALLTAKFALTNNSELYNYIDSVMDKNIKAGLINHREEIPYKEIIILEDFYCWLQKTYKIDKFIH